MRLTHAPWELDSGQDVAMSQVLIWTQTNAMVVAVCWGCVDEEGIWQRRTDNRREIMESRRRTTHVGLSQVHSEDFAISSVGQKLLQ